MMPGAAPFVTPAAPMGAAPAAAAANVTTASYVAPAAPGYGAPGYGAPGPVYAPAPAYSAVPAVSPAGPQWNMQGTMTTVRPSVAQIMSASRAAPTVAQQTHAVRPAAYAAGGGPALGGPAPASPATGGPAAPTASRPLAFPGQAAPPMVAAHRAVGPYAAGPIVGGGPYGGAPLTAQVPQGMPAGMAPAGVEYSGPVTSYETLPGSVLQRSPTMAPSTGPLPGAYSGPSMWGGSAPTPDQLSTGYGPAGPAGAAGYDPGMFDGYGDYGGSCGGNCGGGCDPCDPCAGNCGPWFASFGGLVMTRDVPNNKGLAFVNTEPALSVLNTEEAGFDWVGGWEGRIGRSIGQQWAVEAVYWGLQPMDTEISARGADNLNSRLDFGTQAFDGTLMSTYFNDSREQRIHRVDEFHNVEFNLLQSALAVDPAGRFGMTFFSGARYFYYREDFDYMGVMAGAEFFQNDPTTFAGYHIKARNRLIGWQIGARGTMYVGNKFRLYATPRFGLFANNISQYQELCMVIYQHSNKLDVAVLGQIDLGMSYQLFRCCSVYAGYRAMGIAGVANADDNIPFSFMSQPDMAQINSSGSIILHGGQFGVQFQF
jgi:hypothetical protein